MKEIKDAKAIFFEVGIEFGFEKAWLEDLWYEAESANLNNPEDCEKLRNKMKDMINELARRVKNVGNT